MTERTFTVTKDNILTMTQTIWKFLSDAVTRGDVIVKFLRASKTRLQEMKYHAMIEDISKQITFYGKKRYSPKVWKAQLIEQFALEKEQMGDPLRHPTETVMSLDGKRVITIRPSSTEFSVKEANEFIEYLYQQGAEMEVVWSEKALMDIEKYRQAQ